MEMQINLHVLLQIVLEIWSKFGNSSCMLLM